MKIAIIGGHIKGIEIVCLARQAGIYTVLIDRDKSTPASGLSSESYVFDVEKKESALLSILKNVDMVIPALEEKKALQAIEEMCIEIGIKVAFDFVAYDVTSVKIQADTLINDEGFPHLKYYPNAQPPYLLKPAEGKRRGLMRKVNTLAELEFLMSTENNPDSWIAQEYVPGLLYSLEVIGSKGNYKAYDVTEISLTSDFDFNLVKCPSTLEPAFKKKFEEYALVLAERIQVSGIMHAEAIMQDGDLKIIEVNAVFPSQTPITIFYSTGINMLVELLKVYADDQMMNKLNEMTAKPYVRQKYVVHKNFQFNGQTPAFEGEGNMDNAGPLKIIHDLFETDYAITDYIDDSHEWQAVFINIADSEEQLVEDRIRSRELVLQHCRRQL